MGNNDLIFISVPPDRGTPCLGVSPRMHVLEVHLGTASLRYGQNKTIFESHVHLV